MRRRAGPGAVNLCAGPAAWKAADPETGAGLERAFVTGVARECGLPYSCDDQVDSATQCSFLKPQDCLIASVAVRLSLPFVTRNADHLQANSANRSRALY
jgi:hypothetical protein